MSFELVLGNSHQCLVTAGAAEQTESLGLLYLGMSLPS